MLNSIQLKQMKLDNDKIAMITAYDYPSAKQAEAAGADMLLVGDSLGMVVLGYQATTQVTLDDMIHHAKAVKRGAPNTYIVVDMPFMSYHSSTEQAINNATKLFQESDAQAIKIEGMSDDIDELTRKLTVGGIPVVGHLGLTPQTVNVLGGYRVQGNSKEGSVKLLEDAKRYEEAGAVAVVLECIPKELGELITNELSIPTIGIGAGIDTNGQVLVYHDILHYGNDKFAKFVKNYANFDDIGIAGIKQYVDEVKAKTFPEEKHTYTIKNANMLPK